MKRSSGKISMGIISPVVILTIVLFFLPKVAFTIDYSFTTIDVPGATTNWGVNGINDSGDIVGTYDDATGRHGYLYAGGVFTTIDFLANTLANGINNSRDIVGYGTGPWYHNFLYSKGIFTTIDVPGATTNWGAKGINDLGDIVGSYGDATGRPGFLYSGGNFTSINVPGAVDGCWTVPMGINNAGAIVGTYNLPDAPGTHRGFLYVGGNFTLIDVPGAVGGNDVNGINDFGEIVGWDYGAGRGFLYAGGRFNTIEVPGAEWTCATGINNSGNIVGYYGDATGRHGFIATPVSKNVSIDIKPASINLKKTSQISVVIVSTEDFDAVNQINQETLSFGRTGSEDSLAYCISKPRDHKKDGVKDLVCFFYVDHTGFKCGDNIGNLYGHTVEGLLIKGSDPINIIPCE